jgi:hypothetical protein
MSQAPDCPEFLKPRLRLFLSADIVGSTALKQSRLGAFSEAGAKSQSSWFSVIQGFYIEARRLFLEEWNALRDAHQDHAALFGESPKIWKTIGDEILFVKVLTDHRQLSIALKCWMAAVRRMRKFLKERDDRLDVKCAAWTAGFPLRNKEVVINNTAPDRVVVEDYYLENGRILNAYYNGEAQDVEIDFIGPSIDIGFRLAFSNSRRFVIGVDIAYILSLTSTTPDKPIDNIKIYFHGSYPLKGVFGGVDYPIFWVDMSEPEGLPRLEDQLSGAGPTDKQHVQEFCESFHREYSSYTFRPFIRSDTEQQIGTSPAEYDQVLGTLIKNFTLAQAPPDEPQEPDAPSPREAEEMGEAGRSIVGELTQADPSVS